MGFPNGCAEAGGGPISAQMLRSPEARGGLDTRLSLPRLPVRVRAPGQGRVGPADGGAGLGFRAADQFNVPGEGRGATPEVTLG